jgi:carboxypeptidase C (cathepsin A)
LPQENPYSWNKFANMVYLESPAGVGYNHFSGRFHYDDENVSYENLKAVQEFFAAFPERRNNDLYLTGESYGGIYIPYLALRIDEYNQNATDLINLKGFAIGNGVTNWKYDTAPAFVKMAWAHGLISNDLNERILASDCDFADVGAPPQSKYCRQLFSEFERSVSQVYPYDIYRPPEDFYQTSPNFSIQEYLSKEDTVAPSYASFSKLFKNKQRSSNDFAPVNKFMNSEDTKKAMNIPSEYSWSECSNIDYTMLEKATQWIYPILKGRYRMVHYSGTTDGVVPTIGTEQWMEDLGWKVTQNRTAWMSQPKLLGGYTQSREGLLDFISIHGCGHMAPQWKRQPAHLAIGSWIHGEDLPRP